MKRLAGVAIWAAITTAMFSGCQRAQNAGFLGGPFGMHNSEAAYSEAPPSMYQAPPTVAPQGAGAAYPQSATAPAFEGSGSR